MPRGGKREGAGRKHRAGEEVTVFTVKLTEAELAELTDGLYEGESISELLRDGALERVRNRPGGR